MFFNWIIDHIPIWVWLVLLFGGTGALFYFFSPILVPIWNLTPRWIKVLGAGIISVILAALAGRYKGRRDAEDEQRKRDAQAIETRKETHDEVQKLSPSDRRKRLDGWVRDE
jgi:protein-S-isoprenylcysteine O-methyltransferase Ste14